jgi:orotidine-5'-phosphate decarboxylase
MRNGGLTASERLVIALDVDSAEEALRLVAQLKDVAGMFKVGHQLFTAFGPEVVRKITAQGARVFLDLKYHDIPNTVAKAAAEAVKLGVSIFNVHALGGFDMMRAAAEAAREAAEKHGLGVPAVLAVTILTSMDEKTVRRELKITRSLRREVTHLARLALRAGLHGVVASPLEIKPLRRSVRDGFVILTPGVRPDWSGTDDQKRVMTPGEAVSAGADYIVVGRPVLKAADRQAAAEKIVEEIEKAGRRQRADDGQSTMRNQKYDGNC